MDFGTPLKLIADAGELVQLHPFLTIAVALAAVVALGALGLVLNFSPRWSGSRPAKPYSEALSPALRSIENYVSEIFTERPRCEIPWQQVAAALREEWVLSLRLEGSPVQPTPGLSVRAEIAAWASRHGWRLEWNGKSEVLVITRGNG